MYLYPGTGTHEKYVFTCHVPVCKHMLHVIMNDDAYIHVPQTCTVDMYRYIFLYMYMYLNGTVYFLKTKKYIY